MKQRVGLLCLAGLCSLGPLLAWSQTLPIPQIINSVNIDSLKTAVRVLAGDSPFQLGDSSYLIANRRCYDTTGCKLARQYLYEKFQSLGLPTRLDTFIDPELFASANVIAEQPGTVTPKIKVIVCAHYDDLSFLGGVSPGADADASGCAGVLEAARVLSRYKTGFTIVYAIWDWTELGNRGSDWYAYSARARGDSILGVLNLDQIGYDSTNSHVSEVYFQKVAQSEQLADSVLMVATRYPIDSQKVNKDSGPIESDHFSFYYYGYTAVLLTEEASKYNNSPCAESVNDKFATLNLSTFLSRAKLVAATVAWMAQVGDPLSVSKAPSLPQTCQLEQNYPNPFNPC
jgi:Zn-dependent M28 family amino/carboxypeptidase